MLKKCTTFYYDDVAGRDGRGHVEGVTCATLPRLLGCPCLSVMQEYQWKREKKRTYTSKLEQMWRHNGCRTLCIHICSRNSSTCLAVAADNSMAQALLLWKRNDGGGRKERKTRGISTFMTVWSRDQPRVVLDCSFT
jgi:hypothetical protein